VALIPAPDARCPSAPLGYVVYMFAHRIHRLCIFLLSHLVSLFSYLRYRIAVQIRLLSTTTKVSSHRSRPRSWVGNGRWDRAFFWCFVQITAPQTQNHSLCYLLAPSSLPPVRPIYFPA
jgi:hypothetical protein